MGSWRFVGESVVEGASCEIGGWSFGSHYGIGFIEGVGLSAGILVEDGPARIGGPVLNVV